MKSKKKNNKRRAQRDIKTITKESGKKKKILLTVLSSLFVILALLFVAVLFIEPSIDTTSTPFDSNDFMSLFGKKSAYTYENDYRYFRTRTLGTLYNLSDFYGNGKLKGEKEGEIIRSKNEYNILVVGKDRVGSNTDVIMVVNFDAETQEVNILQIPRDTYVEDQINVNKSKRINAVYAFAYTKNIRSMSHDEASKASLQYLEKVVEDTFGITIDNHFMIDLNAFVKIIDSIGGVYVDVPFDMFYNDEEQNLHINLKKGAQTLNGNQSEQFVRFRNTYVMGDLGRVSAQKIFLSALVEKLLSPEWYTLDKLTSVASDLIKYSTTSVTLPDIVGYLKQIDFAKLSDDSITFYTAQGESFFASGGASMYTLYMKENLEIINKAFNLYNVDVTEKHVTLLEKMRSEAHLADTNGLTAKDIEKEQPHIIVARPKPIVVTPPTEEETDVGEETPNTEEVLEEETELPIEWQDTPIEWEEEPEETDLPEDTTTDFEELVESGEYVPEEPTEDTYTETERIETDEQ